MQVEDINTNATQLWVSRIKEAWKDKVFVSDENLPLEVEKELFGDLHSGRKFQDHEDFNVIWETTSFIYRRMKKGGFWLLLNEQVNNQPFWEKRGKRKDSIASFKRRNETGVKKRKIDEKNARNIIQEEDEEEDSDRDKNRKSNLNQNLIKEKNWLNINISENAKILLPNTSKDGIFKNQNFPMELSIDEIFGISKLWIDHLEMENVKLLAFVNPIISKKEGESLDQKEVLKWIQGIASVTIEQRHGLVALAHMNATIIRKLYKVDEIQKKGGSLKEMKKINELEKKTAQLKSQIGKKTNQSFKSIRERISKINIKKYKEEKTWIEKNEWNKLSYFEKIMKRWRFSDLHQCLAPWDEAKLTPQELQEFHNRKKEWRAKRRDELSKNNNYYNNWRLRRFDRFSHARIIGNRFWTGLDISYDDYLGVNRQYERISWKVVRKRNNWRTWKPRINTEFADEMKYWGDNANTVQKNQH